MDLNTVWFLLVGVLIIGYAILDGFDLGVGSLYYLLGKTEEEKRLLINAIGPFWDGNEVWLLTGGGALFAAFPLVYASVFSGFYLAMMLVLLGLIFRAVAIEYRNKVDDQAWQARWDFLFFLGSFLPALLFGVAVGNVAKGLPLDSAYHYTGGFFGLLNPYALLLGLLGLFGFLMQGTTYTMLKTEGVLQERARGLFSRIWTIFVVLYVLASLYTYLVAPALFVNYSNLPVLDVIPLLAILGIALTPQAVKAARYGTAFFASSLTMAGMILTLAVGMFPNWVPAVDPNLSLTIYNASSSQLTLKTMLIIALMGVPIVLFYTIYVYRVFRGKVKLEQDGY
ncbi:MAG: cytochrome d ubiquinol oxidase subunit II [Clostridia bacterium]|nr:cytochrome d ubiquinol oxidase subunit II [Clostridia bacterium]